MDSKERGNYKNLSHYLAYGDANSIATPMIDLEAFKENKQFYQYIIDNTKTYTDSANIEHENEAYGWTYYYNTQTNRYELYSTKRVEFRKEIIAKSVLAGVSPFIVRDSSKFNYQVNEKDKEYQKVVAVKPVVDMAFKFTDEQSGKTATYKLQDGESILFYRPSLIEDT